MVNLMAKIEVRTATLDDTAAISALFRARIGAWQRLDAAGHVQDVAYDVLTIYERWMHGGAWMSVETGAIHLCHLLLGAGLPLVAILDGAIVGYAEGYVGTEPPPFGQHLNLGEISIHPDHERAGVEHALMDALITAAQGLKCARVTVSVVMDAGFYRHFGLEPLLRLQRYSLPARSGQVFYKSAEHSDADAGQIANWQMPVGRLTSARQQWEMLWPLTWNAVAEIASRRTDRLRLSAAGQDALLLLQQQLYAPRSADVYIWSPKPFTNQLLSAVRDYAYRENYRTLVMMVSEATAKIFGGEAEADGYYHDLYALEL